jgi:hypothetical protein
VKIIKNERDPSLFTGKLLIKFLNILRNTTQVIIWHRVKILFSIISSPITLVWTGEERRIPCIFDDFHFYRYLIMTENRIFTLCRMITWVVFLRMFWNFISSLPVKRGGSLSFFKQVSLYFYTGHQVNQIRCFINCYIKILKSPLNMIIIDKKNK